MGIRQRVAVVGVLCAGLPLAGCASSTAGSSVVPGGSVSSSPWSPSPSDESSPSALPSGLSLPPSPTPKPSLAAQTLTGDVEPGVERGCLILRDGGKTYLLIGGDPAVVHEGARVRVTGRVNTDLKSYCMQGVPFQVSEAHSM
jgi:hypothetical protein